VLGHAQQMAVSNKCQHHVMCNAMVSVLGQV